MVTSGWGWATVNNKTQDQYKIRHEKVKMVCPVCGDTTYDTPDRLRYKNCNYNNQTGISHAPSDMYIEGTR